MRKAKTPIPQGMISLTEASEIMGKPYSYLYSSMIFWIPLLEILTFNGHRYCSYDRVVETRILLDGGYIPSFKYKSIVKTKTVHTLNSITQFGIMWVKP